MTESASLLLQFLYWVIWLWRSGIKGESKALHNLDKKGRDSKKFWEKKDFIGSN